jgi:hypothetical protein
MNLLFIETLLNKKRHFFTFSSRSPSYGKASLPARALETIKAYYLRQNNPVKKSYQQVTFFSSTTRFCLPIVKKSSFDTTTFNSQDFTPMKRILASLLLAASAGTTVSMLSAQSAAADPYYRDSRTPSIIVVPNGGQYSHDRYDKDRRDDRDDRYDRYDRHDDYRGRDGRHNRNRVWVPGHYERVGYGHYGRRWVAGHWEYRR